MRVGRLFWRFFGFVALAQLGVTLAAGLFLRWSEPPGGPGPGPERGDVRVAAGIVERLGPQGFEQWIRAPGPPVHVLAVDESGQELLHRKVPPDQLERLQTRGDSSGSGPGIRGVMAPDGKRYWLLGDSRGPGGADRPPGPPRRTWLPNLSPGVIGVTLACSVLTAWLLALYVTRPIQILRRAFTAAAGGDLNRRVSIDLAYRKDELAELGADFDRMASRLKLSMESQRNLLHDVSHELRSPLARVQAAVDLLRDDPALIVRMTRQIDVEVGRIDDLVGQLLFLSRLEVGGLEAGQQQDVDMHDLVADIVSDTCFETQADGSALTWVEEGPRVVVQGAEQLLHSAIENVVRNAFKHGGGGVRIESGCVDGRNYRIRILDEGPGVSPQDLDRLFTPFFRGSQASGSGYGLGLAIARRSVEAHGGTIQASNREGGGLCMQIDLPCQVARAALTGQA